MLIIGPIKADNVCSSLAQPLDVRRRVLYVQIGPDSGLVRHKAEVSIGNEGSPVTLTWLLEPVNGIAGNGLVPPRYVKAVTNDSNVNTGVT
jgi:hypothetical protein